MKLTPNNLKQASKELEKFDESLLESIKEINASDRKSYVVVMIRIVAKPDSPKNDVQAQKQYFTGQGYEKLKENFRFLGYSKIILLHDPTKMDEDFTTAPEHQTKTENALRDKIANEIKAENEEEIERRVAERMAEMTKAKSETETDEKATAKAETKTAKTETEVDLENELDVLENGTVKHLKAFAKNNEIDLSGQTAKDDIKNTIQTWVDEQKAE